MIFKIYLLMGRINRFEGVLDERSLVKGMVLEQNICCRYVREFLKTYSPSFQVISSSSILNLISTIMDVKEFGFHLKSSIYVDTM